MALDETDRLIIEDSIYECQVSVDKYLQTQKPTHAKMLKYNIEQTMELLYEYQKEVQVDDERDKYRLHLLVPLQVYELLKMRGALDDPR